MANEINVDSLSIEIKSNSDKAATALDNLANKLDDLGKKVSAMPSLIKVSNQLEKLSIAASRAKSTGLADLVTQLERVSKLKLPSFNTTANSLNKLAQSVNSIGQINDVSTFTTRIEEIVTSIKPLETLGKNSVAPFISSMRAIPKLVNSIDTSTLARFKQLVQDIVVAIAPLAERAEKSERGLVALNGIMQATVRSNGNLAASNATLVRSYTSLGSVFTSLRAKMIASVYVGRRLGSVFGDALQQSNEYVENINLFTVAMGDAAGKAFDFAQEVNSALGIDVAEWTRSQGVFKQITSGFGVATEKANLMSQQLTQLGYDISSFFNIKTEESMQKLQSGISGELEPLIVAA